ncbi:hypothetical protein SLA_5127 [Streptomyces laurentii]|uniref:Uncharacterized protein n=1 Tax=Streptomyces laurentii TaxID=39478 RepID=A0A160P368_STRLU|nr:hypothetical protein SLA_5127 [Streptomyces laurentii]
MSWDVLLFRLPAGITSSEDIPADYTPPPLGTPQDVGAAVRAAVPGVDLSDPAWGELVGPSWSMELNIGDADAVHSVMLHIRGSGDDVLAVVFRIADALGCRALDLSSGLLEPDGPDGWHAFQEYRDRVLGTSD